MKENMTIGEITESVANASTAFEEANTGMKRKYLLWWFVWMEQKLEW